MWFYLGIVIIILILIYILVIFNSLVKLKNMVNEAFATMDVYLKKRWDLIPNLVETVKGYAKHEKDTLESVIKLRNGVYENMNQNDKIDQNELLSSKISRLMLFAERYPDLKANKNFLDLSYQLTKVEDEIANSRKYYNAVVKKLNIKIGMVPSNIVANMFNFKPSKMFEANINERDNVKVEL